LPALSVDELGFKFAINFINWHNYGRRGAQTDCLCEIIVLS